MEQTATKGSAGDSQSFGNGVDHERRSSGHHGHGGRASVRHRSDVDRQARRHALTPKQAITSP
jgi:hypothetical protein